MIITSYVSQTILITACLITVTFGQSEPIGPSTGSVRLKLVREYKNNLLEDISTDGKLLLFYETNQFMRVFTVPIGTGSTRSDRAGPIKDFLRVVDRVSGREIARIETNNFPFAAEFIRGTDKVMYAEGQTDSTKPGVKEILWDPANGTKTVCLNSPDLSLAPGEAGFDFNGSINATQGVGSFWRRGGGDTLVSVTIPGCGLKRIGPVNPSDPDDRISGGTPDISVTPNGEHLAYRTRSGAMIIRHSVSLQLVASISPPSGLMLGDRFGFSPNGTYFVALASNTLSDGPNTRRYLVFYSATDFKVLRKLDITHWKPPDIRPDMTVFSDHLGTAMAISPDGSVVALSFTKKIKTGFVTYELPEIVLYDLVSGKELARVSHPLLKENRKDPFASQIGRLVFTPAGDYLISTTHDTLVWQVSR